VIKPVTVTNVDLELFRTAISAYDGSVNSTSEQTYVELDQACARMRELIDLLEEGHSLRYGGA
jgi:hypothetical protein